MATLKELNNQKRADAARKAYRAYYKALHGSSKLPTHPEDFSDMIGDLVSDSLHLAVAEGHAPHEVRLDRIESRARDHFEYERLEEKNPEAAEDLFNSTPPGQRMVFPPEPCV